MMDDLGNLLMATVPKPVRYEVSLEKRNLIGGGKLLVWSLPLNLVGKRDRGM